MDIKIIKNNNNTVPNNNTKGVLNVSLIKRVYLKFII